MSAKFYFHPLRPGQVAIYDLGGDLPYAYVGSSADDKDHWVVHHSLDIHGFGDKCLYTGMGKPLVPTHELVGTRGDKFQQWIRNRVAEVNITGTFVVPYMFTGADRNWGQLVYAGLLFLPTISATKFGKWHFSGRTKDAASLAFLATRFLICKHADGPSMLNHTDYNVLRYRLRQLRYANQNDGGSRATAKA